MTFQPVPCVTGALALCLLAVPAVAGGDPDYRNYGHGPSYKDGTTYQPPERQYAPRPSRQQHIHQQSKQRRAHRRSRQQHVHQQPRPQRVYQQAPQQRVYQQPSHYTPSYASYPSYQQYYYVYPATSVPTYHYGYSYPSYRNSYCNCYRRRCR